MKEYVKKNWGAFILGAIALGMIYVSYVFWGAIVQVNKNAIANQQIVAWICRVDPSACGTQTPTTNPPAATPAPAKK